MKFKYLLSKLLNGGCNNSYHLLFNEIQHLRKEIDKINLHIGELHGKLNILNIDSTSDLKRNEFQVYSQWGDDGIIHFLINFLDIKNKTFIEFGVENYKESNTRFLLLHNNWRGLVIDGSEDNIHYIKNDDFFWKYDLTACSAFITKENINSLIQENGFDQEIGLLHIDIDGNDYWIWKEISVINPDIVIIEYNSLFGDDNAWTIPYESGFIRTKAHYSNLYFGASLLALCDLASEKGYSFVGTNSNGNNAYFIKNEKIKSLKVLNAKEGFIDSKFSEARDTDYNLTFIRGHGRLNLIKGLPIYNTRVGGIEFI